MKKNIEMKTFRWIVETLLRRSIGSDYLNDILDKETGNGRTIIELIKQDVEDASAWKEEGFYNEDDIRLAIGRTLADHIGL